MKKEILGTYTYKFPEPTDEEIQKEIDAEGLTGVVEPNDVRNYYRDKIYEELSKRVMK